MAKRKSVTVEKGIFYQYDPSDASERKYYYVRVNGGRKYCGEGELGYRKAKMARAEFEKRRTLQDLDGLGLEQDADAIRERDKKKPQFKTVAGLVNWYMGLPSVEAQSSHSRKTTAAKHLLDYFGKMHPDDVQSDTTEYYREHRKGQGAAESTINVELALLSVAYNKAVKSKKLPTDCKPGEFVMVEDRNPRPIVTDAQYEILLEHAGPEFRDILIGAYESAMRSNELCTLRVGPPRCYSQRGSTR